VGVVIAPRIDPRVRKLIVGADFFASPAEVTRAAGELAWQLGLPRPSYQQVRELMGGANRPAALAAPVQTSKGRLVLKGLEEAANFLYQYPGPGLEDWYRRYKRGLV
jgi:hypothetical protein